MIPITHPFRKVREKDGAPARKIAAIALKIWKKGEAFDAEHLKLQAA